MGEIRRNYPVLHTVSENPLYIKQSKPFGEPYPSKYDKKEFVYMFRDEFSQFNNYRPDPNRFILGLMGKYLAETAREWFGYSPKSDNVSIALSYLGLYCKMKYRENIIL